MMQIKCRKSATDSEMVEIMQAHRGHIHLYGIVHEDLFYDAADSYAATSMLQRMDNRGETITLEITMVKEWDGLDRFGKAQKRQLRHLTTIKRPPAETTSGEGAKEEGCQDTATPMTQETARNIKPGKPALSQDAPNRQERRGGRIGA